MKQLIGFLNLRRTLAALVVFGLATSGLHAERLNAWIVAEQNTPSRATTSPAPAVSSPYVLVDGGYVEEGDSVANERVADAGAVRAAVASGLEAAGFQAPANGDAASVIIYHWGVIRRSTYDRTGYRGLSFNARARIRLVADVRHVERIEQVLEAGISGMPWYMPSRTRDLLSYAGDSRYFLVVSAYDAEAAREGQATLRWRTKLSVTDNEANMQTAVRTLAIAGSEYLGASVEPRSVHLTVPESFPAPSVDAPPAFSEVWTSLVEHERKQLLGESLAQEYINAFRRQISIAVADPSLPPEVQARLDEYRREKRRLQEALATRVAGISANERAKAIDAFNKENAAAIAALNDEERAIRSELSRIATLSPKAGAALEDDLIELQGEPSRAADNAASRGKQ